MLKIKSVSKGTIGEEIGLKSGDVIVNFNKKGDADILDYLFFDASEEFTLTVQSDEGITDIDIEKYPEESLGLVFYDDSAQLKPKKCGNRCIFCFVDQLPKGMRNTLLIKDDDYRLSFVTGNYVTLTNITDYDIERIISRKLSPLYISVHATDDDVRRRLLGSKKAGGILNIIERLSGGGIVMHCQVVLCPQINDGEVLKKTVADLYKFYPAVKSLAVVPVGLTAFREGLPQILPLSRHDAQKAIEICGGYTGFACCSDEMYIKAGLELPPYEFYGEFEQIENGVGLIRKFEREFNEAFTASAKPRKRDVLVITGVSSYDFISGLVSKFSEKYNFETINVLPVKNKFFGESITVSGLVCGCDIAEQAAGLRCGEVILPKSMLKEFEDVFLDGTDIIALEKRLGCDVKVCGVTGYEFFDALCGDN